MSSSNPAVNLSASASKRRLGAAFILLVGLAGLGVSGYLTVLKFRMAYTPCLTTAAAATSAACPARTP
jgi:hypothetical protein